LRHTFAATRDQEQEQVSILKNISYPAKFSSPSHISSNGNRPLDRPATPAMIESEHKEVSSLVKTNTEPIRVSDDKSIQGVKYVKDSVSGVYTPRDPSTVHEPSFGGPLANEDTKDEFDKKQEGTRIPMADTFQAPAKID
jgi:hypothetical protein